MTSAKATGATTAASNTAPNTKTEEPASPFPWDTILQYVQDSGQMNPPTGAILVLKSQPLMLKKCRHCPLAFSAWSTYDAHAAKEHPKEEMSPKANRLKDFPHMKPTP